MASFRPMASSERMAVSLLRMIERNRSGTVVSASVPWMLSSSDMRCSVYMDLGLWTLDLVALNIQRRVSGNSWLGTIRHSTFDTSTLRHFDTRVCQLRTTSQSNVECRVSNRGQDSKRPEVPGCGLPGPRSKVQGPERGQDKVPVTGLVLSNSAIPTAFLVVDFTRYIAASAWRTRSSLDTACVG